MAIANIPKILAKACVKRYGNWLMRYPREVQQKQRAMLMQVQWMQPVVEEVWRELFPPPVAKPEEDAIAPVNVPLPEAAGIQTFDSAYRRYACTQNDPLRCSLCVPIVQEEGPLITHCAQCKFPSLLMEKAEVAGQRGNYRIDRGIGRRSMGRLYAATLLGMNQPVVIKEYILPKLYFNNDERWQRQQAFKNLAGLDLADGRVQDFRFVAPLEAIVDEREPRCYHILDDRYLYPTLNQHLIHGAFSPTQVRVALNQLLQSLECLHGQKFRLPSGQIQTGMIHGNLTLDSVLIANKEPVQAEPGSEAGLVEPTTNFFVYLCDLALWERLFEPPRSRGYELSATIDLQGLGYIAFYLLSGQAINDAGQALDPRVERHWPPIDTALKHFILRLLGIEAEFETAEAARRELQKLPPAPLTNPIELTASSETEVVKKPSRALLIGLGAIGLALLGWIAWTLLRPQFSTATRTAPQLNALKDVGGIPPGKFTYTATEDGTWSYVLQTPDLIQRGATLEQKLQTAQPKLQLTFDPAASTASAIARVQAGQAAFAVVPLLQALPDELEATPIAYDGIAAFVAFSYAKRDRSLPTQLNGQLSLEQLRQLYSGQIASWKEFSPSTLAVNLYAPDDRESLDAFEQKLFSKLQPRREASGLPQSSAKRLPEFSMLRAIIRDFEANEIGSIGFSPMSKIVGQCSVYPLALQLDQGNTDSSSDRTGDRKSAGTPVQALVLDNGNPVTPSTDLCNSKGSYRTNPILFKSGRYPLSYPIVVVYPRDNDRAPIGQKFAELFKTREGQRLLSQTGLVPLE